MLGVMRVSAPTIEDQIAALDGGRAFADLSMWRIIRVRGSDAESWLNDLLSAELAGLAPGSARWSLLLSPTGRVRAQVSVSAGHDGVLLLQDPVQDTPIQEALAPYVLSSDVALDDLTRDLGLLALPEASARALHADGATSTPSALAPGLVDLLPAASDLPRARERALDAGLAEATPEALEAWRIRHGRARTGVDLGEDGLPHEAALGDLVGHDKGCFLGQEAVAKVRNLGHPPFVLLAVSAAGPLSPGDPVRTGGADVGLVTSADATGEPRWAAIARVRWATREARLEAADGHPLEVRGRASLSQ